MAFSLSKIELHIDDDILALAEKLLENKQLQTVSETEPGLWIGMVITEKASLEVEVFLKGTQVKAHSCDCGKSMKKQYCKHVVTLLLYLLAQRKEKAQKSIANKAITPPKRVTIPYILSLVKSAELKQFVKSYAREDRQFALLLKAQFAYLLPRNKDNEPIEQVLSNTIKSIRRPGKPFRRSDWKVLQKVLGTLLEQTESSLYKKHFSETFETAEAILLQLNPLLLLVDDRKILIANIRKAISLLADLCQQAIAPELQDQIWALCLSESHKKIYYLYDIWDAFLQLLTKLASNKERVDALLELIDSKLNDQFIKKNERISAGLINHKIQLFDLQHNEAALHRYLQENIHQPAVLKQAILLAQQQQNWEQLQQLTQYAIATQQPDEAGLSLLHSQLLTAAIHTKNRSNILRLAQILFLQSYNMEYFQLLKDASGKKWSKLRTGLLDALKKQPSRLDNRQVLALIFAQENMLPDLHKHLLDSKSLDLLVEHGDRLFEQSLKKTQDLYFDVANHYLENYMGRLAAIKIRTSIAHLNNIGQAACAKELSLFIREKFGDRASLLAELDNKQGY